tara:strand:+ start:193 stop:354 length:162 start_codon:yes stop_codon:yes gene_type:complete
MTKEQIYWEEQEYNRAMDIMNKDIMKVTPEELQFVIDYGLVDGKKTKKDKKCQ